MNYIEIADGLSIRIDEVEAIGKKDEFTSIVYTHHNTFDSTFPYNVLLELLESSVDETQSKNEKFEVPALNILKTQGFFGG